MSTTKTRSPRKRSELSVAAVIAVVALALATAAPAGAAQDSGQATAATIRVRISNAAAFDAPIGEKGGISNPMASCSNYRVEPKITWTLTNTDTGWTRTYRWTGDLPGVYFPRVAVGTYESTTTGKCRTVERTRLETVTVEEKTLDGTVSRGEWVQIRRGMTRAQVAEIVGNDGRDPSRWDGRVTMTYDMMRFWRWSFITYRHGRVVDKLWNVAHD